MKTTLKLLLLLVVTPFALVAAFVFFVYGVLRGIGRAIYDHWREWRAERARERELANEYTSFLKDRWASLS